MAIDYVGTTPNTYQETDPAAVTMLYLLFFLLAVVIVVRLVCIQFASPETAAFAQVLSKRILTTKTVTARRGDILMRGGEPIVTTLTRYQVELDFGAEGFDSVEMFRKNSDSLSLLLGRYFGPEVMAVTISVGYSVRTMPGGLVTSGATAAVIRPSSSSRAWLTMSSGSS